MINATNLLNKTRLNMKIGEKLYKFRTENHLKQENMASKFSVSQATYSNWENDKSEPPLIKLPKVAKVLGEDLSTILPQDLLVEISSPSNSENSISMNAIDLMKIIFELQVSIISLKEESSTLQKNYIKKLEDELNELKTNSKFFNSTQ